MSAAAERNVVIRGTGHYLPRRLVTNDEVAPTLGRTGSALEQAIVGQISVRARHWAGDDETVELMAVRAADMAIADAGLARSAIDLLVLSNWTSRVYLPELAPRIAHALGLSNALAFDLCGACAGFVLGATTAVSYLRSGMCRRAVVVSCDQFSRGMKPNTMGMMVVGDAAGAVVLEASEDGPPGILQAVLHSDGGLADLIVSRLPQPWIRSKIELTEHAAALTGAAAEEVLQRERMSARDVDWMIIHPGTDVVTQLARERLGVPPERLLENFTRCGNTSSASIPIVLSEYHHNGTIRRGHTVLTAAVGAGFFHGALLFRF